MCLSLLPEEKEVHETKAILLLTLTSPHTNCLCATSAVGMSTSWADILAYLSHVCLYVDIRYYGIHSL